MTEKEAQRAYDEAEPVPLSEERIDEIVKFATRPAWIDAAAKECAERVLIGAGEQTFAEIIQRHAP